MKISINVVLARSTFFSIFVTINVGIASYFLCFYWYLKIDVICVKFGTHTETKI